MRIPTGFVVGVCRNSWFLAREKLVKVGIKNTVVTGTYNNVMIIAVAVSTSGNIFTANYY